MLKDDNIMNVYHKFYICQLKASTPYSEFLPKIKAELEDLGEQINDIANSSPQKQKSLIDNNNNSSKNKSNEIGRNLNYLAQTINQYENIDFERTIDDNYMKHIIVYENNFYSKVNILGIIYGFDIPSRNSDNKRYILKIDDGTGRISVTFWDNSKFGKEIEKTVKSGVKINIFGKITFFNGNIQITGEKFIIVNNYYVENLFNEILIQEQEVLAKIQKNNKGQFDNSYTNNLLKTIKEKYYTPYNIKLEKNDINNGENQIDSNNDNNNHTTLILRIKNNSNSNALDSNNNSNINNNINTINNNQNNKNIIDPIFEYNIRKFANYFLLVLDEKDLIESANLKYIIDDTEENKIINNNINNNNMYGRSNEIIRNNSKNNYQGIDSFYYLLNKRPSYNVKNNIHSFNDLNQMEINKRPSYNIRSNNMNFYAQIGVDNRLNYTSSNLMNNNNTPISGGYTKIKKLNNNTSNRMQTNLDINNNTFQENQLNQLNQLNPNTLINQSNTMRENQFMNNKVIDNNTFVNPIRNLTQYNNVQNQTPDDTQENEMSLIKKKMLPNNNFYLTENNLQKNRNISAEIKDKKTLFLEQYQNNYVAFQNQLNNINLYENNNNNMNNNMNLYNYGNYI